MFRTISPTGFWLAWDECDPVGEIGGVSAYEGATSPNTGRPLLQVARLYNVGAFPLLARYKQGLPFLYSWSCAIYGDVFAYRLTGDRVEILRHASGQEAPPYAPYPESFPAVGVSLVPISDRQSAIVERLNRGEKSADFYRHGSEEDCISRPKHQIGGKPFLFYPDYAHAAKCPICSDALIFVASFGNDTFSGPPGFVGDEFVQLIYWMCERCDAIVSENFTS